MTRTKRLAALVLALLLALLGACTAATEPPSPSMTPTAGPTTNVWPAYQSRCDAEALFIDIGENGDAAQETQIDGLLKDMDALIFLAAALNDPAVRVAYDADEMTERDTAFQWTVLLRVLSHFAPADQVTQSGAQVKVQREIVESYWRESFQRSAGETMPPIPPELEDTIVLEDGLYVMMPPDGVYPPVSLVLAYIVADDAGRELLAVYADVMRDSEMPIPVQVLLMKRDDGRYVLLSSGLDRGEDEVFADYTVTSYQAVVSVPVECVLREQEDRSAAFEAPNGLTIRVEEEDITGSLEQRRAADVSDHTELIADYMSESGLDYGLVWQDGETLRYELVRLMEPGVLVRVAVNAPLEWVYDYFFLPEMLLESFGGEPMPVDVILAIEMALQ